MVSSVIRRLNDRRDAAADLGEDAGFTLIELMVVLLILAILLAIAIPTFLGVTGGANDRSAQSNLNTALTTAKSAETELGQSYFGLTDKVTTPSAVTPQNLSLDEPSITWVAGPVSTQGPVSYSVDTQSTPAKGQGIILAAWSKNNSTCWFVVDNIGTVTDVTAANGGYAGTGIPTGPGTYYGHATLAASQTCDATASASTGLVGSAGWGSKF